MCWILSFCVYGYRHYIIKQNVEQVQKTLYTVSIMKLNKNMHHDIDQLNRYFCIFHFGSVTLGCDVQQFILYNI